MVLTISLEKVSTGQFLTIFYFAFLVAERELAELEPAELDIVTDPLEPQPNRTEPSVSCIFLMTRYSAILLR